MEIYRKQSRISGQVRWLSQWC